MKRKVDYQVSAQWHETQSRLSGKKPQSCLLGVAFFLLFLRYGSTSCTGILWTNIQTHASTPQRPPLGVAELLLCTNKKPEEGADLLVSCLGLGPYWLFLLSTRWTGPSGCSATSYMGWAINWALGRLTTNERPRWRLRSLYCSSRRPLACLAKYRAWYTDIDVLTYRPWTPLFIHPRPVCNRAVQSMHRSTHI